MTRSSRQVLHYCRQCGESFEHSAEQSAHRSALIHERINRHVYMNEMDLSCSSNCMAAAQSDETYLGRMVYGNVPKTERTPEERKRIAKLARKMFNGEDD